MVTFIHIYAAVVWISVIAFWANTGVVAREVLTDGVLTANVRLEAFVDVWKREVRILMDGITYS